MDKKLYSYFSVDPTCFIRKGLLVPGIFIEPLSFNFSDVLKICFSKLPDILKYLH